MTARRATAQLAVALALTAALAACETLKQLSAPATDPTSVTIQDPAAVELVRSLAQFVTQRARTVDELTVRLGSAQPSSDGAIRIAPSDPLLRGVRITRDPAGAPFAIDLALARPIAVADLKAAFGVYWAQASSESGGPWPVMFHDAVQGDAGRVSLIVAIAGPLPEIDKKATEMVTLRIDPPAP